MCFREGYPSRDREREGESMSCFGGVFDPELPQTVTVDRRSSSTSHFPVQIEIHSP